jgi:hypothetical protein
MLYEPFIHSQFHMQQRFEFFHGVSWEGALPQPHVVLSGVKLLVPFCSHIEKLDNACMINDNKNCDTLLQKTDRSVFKPSGCER